MLCYVILTQSQGQDLFDSFSNKQHRNDFHLNISLTVY